MHFRKLHGKPDKWSDDVKAEIVEWVEKCEEEKLRQLDAKKWTEAAIAKRLGVDRTTVTKWFSKPLRNVNGHNTQHEPQPKPDARVKLNGGAKKVVVELIRSILSPIGDTGFEFFSMFSTILENGGRSHEQESIGMDGMATDNRDGITLDRELQRACLDATIALSRINQIREQMRRRRQRGAQSDTMHPTAARV